MSDKLEDLLFIVSVLVWFAAFIICLVGGLIT